MTGLVFIIENKSVVIVSITHQENSHTNYPHNSRQFMPGTFINI